MEEAQMFVAAAKAADWPAVEVAMSEAAYLRWALSVFGAICFALGGVIARLVVLAHRRDSHATREHIDAKMDSIERSASASREAIAQRIADRDEALKLRLDSQDRLLGALQQSMEDARQTQFEEIQAIRDLYYQLDKRIDRLEQEDKRRSQQVRHTDYSQGPR